MKRHLVLFGAGLVFALGLGLAGMTQPSKVVGFLDFFGAWDPSLAFVMAGAVGVYAIGRRLVLRRPAPVFAASFPAPPPSTVDARLLGGAAIFGIGWGLSGFCPGPALVSLGARSGPAVLVVLGMAAGSLLVGLVDRARAGSGERVPEPT